MCGISGEVSYSANTDLREHISRMNESLVHRGPDDDGTFFFENVGLGHRRLAIIDLSERGHQPMSIDSGRFVITFNGEIYNYLELRKELSLLGASFASTTDTEVILQAYKFWGIECLQKLNGILLLQSGISQKQDYG